MVGAIAPIRPALRPYWDGLSEETRRAALDKLEIVHEILTGYRDGHAEPRARWRTAPTLRRRLRRLRGGALSRDGGRVAARSCGRSCPQRRIANGEIKRSAPVDSTIRNWVRAWKRDGLLGLLDARSLRREQTWERIDERYRTVAELVFATLDEIGRTPTSASLIGGSG